MRVAVVPLGSGLAQGMQQFRFVRAAYHEGTGCLHRFGGKALPTRGGRGRERQRKGVPHRLSTSAVEDVFPEDQESRPRSGKQPFH